MASPQWPAPTITVVVCGTSVISRSLGTGSGDLDGDAGRVGEDVVDGRALLRLRDQRPDLFGGGVGVDLVADGDAAEAIADSGVGAENPVQVHLGGQGRPHRPELDRPLLGDGGDACGQAAAQGDQDTLHRRGTVVLRGELQRVVDVVAEPRVVLLLAAEAVERLDVRTAVRAVDPRHRRTPLELRDLRRVGQGVAYAEQRLDVDAVVDGDLRCSHVVPLVDVRRGRPWNAAALKVFPPVRNSR